MICCDNLPRHFQSILPRVLFCYRHPHDGVAQSFLLAVLLGGYLFFPYRFLTRKTFCDKYFNMSIPVLAVIVCAVMLTVQFNIVVLLGMVGALSIVRFRTAVKSPMGLVFLLWAIAIGIICGASIHFEYDFFGSCWFCNQWCVHFGQLCEEG